MMITRKTMALLFRFGSSKDCPAKLCCFLWILAHIFVTVGGQNNGVIVGVTEEVVASAGASAVLNCTVSFAASSQDDNIVEWAFLNATGGPKSVTRDCRVIEEHNRFSGKEKYEISCFDLPGANVKYSLKVNMLSFPDFGIYQCRNRLQNEQLPTGTLNVNLTVLSPPKVQNSATPLSLDVYINDNVSISCSAEGIPAPNVTWGRANGKPLSPERSRQVTNKVSPIVTTTTLTLINVTKEDTGTYRCSADNNIRPPDEFFSRIAVQYRPTVATVEPSYGSATGENMEVMIWCRVSGYPRPAMNWYGMSRANSERYANGEFQLDDAFFANAKLIVTDEKFVVEQKIMTVGRLSTVDSMFYSLTIRSVEPGDMHFFVCRAENTFGSAATAVNLYRINTLTDQSRSATRSGAGVNAASMSMLYLLVLYLRL